MMPRCKTPLIAFVLGLAFDIRNETRREVVVKGMCSRMPVFDVISSVCWRTGAFVRWVGCSPFAPLYSIDNILSQVG